MKNPVSFIVKLICCVRDLIVWKLKNVPIVIVNHCVQNRAKFTEILKNTINLVKKIVLTFISKKMNLNPLLVCFIHWLPFMYSTVPYMFVLFWFTSWSMSSKFQVHWRKRPVIINVKLINKLLSFMVTRCLEMILHVSWNTRLEQCPEAARSYVVFIQILVLASSSS